LLKDDKGRPIATVVADYVTDEDAARCRVEDATDQDKAMVFLRSSPGRGFGYIRVTLKALLRVFRLVCS
jgi:hypothetical protein